MSIIYYVDQNTADDAFCFDYDIGQAVSRIRAELPEGTQVEVQAEPSGIYNAGGLRALDVPGVLYDIARDQIENAIAQASIGFDVENEE